jgi:hypothetical protein
VVNSLAEGRSPLRTFSRVVAPSGSSAIRRRTSVISGEDAPERPICIANQYMSYALRSRSCHQRVIAMSRATAEPDISPTAVDSDFAWHSASAMPCAGEKSLKCPASPTSTQPGPADSRT